MEEILKVVEEVCAKYGYNCEDKEGRDSLKTVLLKIIPAMLKDRNEQDRQLFYRMLKNTPIAVVDNITPEKLEKLKEIYIGKNVNEHIIEQKPDLGEYGKTIGAGAYVAEPIFDENMNLQEKRSFIYVQNIKDQKIANFLGTNINVSDLIHELGHAWNAEKKQFEIQENGILKERIGMAEFTYSFTKDKETNKFFKKCINQQGLMIEESYNTLEEERAMARYMNIPLSQMKKEYKETLIPSIYQGYMKEFMEYMLENLGEEDFKRYRLYGDESRKIKINNLMEKTDYWKNRTTDILASSESPRNYERKREVISKINEEKVQSFFEKYKDIYFPNISQMTPLQKIENVLEQVYNLNEMKYSMEIGSYIEFLDRLGYEGFSLINQSKNLLEKDNDIDDDNER